MKSAWWMGVLLMAAAPAVAPDSGACSRTSLAGNARSLAEKMAAAAGLRVGALVALLDAMTAPAARAALACPDNDHSA